VSYSPLGIQRGNHVAAPEWAPGPGGLPHQAISARVRPYQRRPSALAFSLELALQFQDFGGQGAGGVLKS